MLINHPAIRRLAGFASGAFSTWMPKLYAYYKEKMGALYERYPELTRTFNNSIWSTSTFNFGPQTVCFDHIDFKNLSFGMCSITPLGDFDPTLGGHLILWDLKMVIEFPAGTTAIIPSAVLRHSNTSIQKGETRMSFTQYTAGGLFRWVDYGFQTVTAFLASKKWARTELEKEGATRWQMGLGLFSTLKELLGQ
jgi:hypothetical protein